MRVRDLRAWLAGAILLASPLLAAAAPGSFVYVATKCAASQPNCTPSVQVYDASTAALVTSIPIGSGIPSWLAISPDGSRVYVSVFLPNLNTSNIVVVDATRHSASTFHVPQSLGKLAVSRDGKLLFAAGNGLFIFDTATDQLIHSIQSPQVFTALAADPAQDRVYWLEGTDCSFGSAFGAYDTARRDLVPNSIGSFNIAWSDLFVSRDDTRLYLTGDGTFCATGNGDVRFLDPVSLTQVKDLGAPALSSSTVLSGPVQTVEAPGRRRMYVLNVFGTVGVFDRDTFAPISHVPITPTPPTTFMSMAVTANEARGYITSPDVLHVFNLATNTVDRAFSVPGLVPGIVATPPNAAATVCSYRIDTSQSSWTVNGGSSSIGLKSGCAWSATSDSPWARLTATSGSGDATLSLTVDPNFTTTNRTATLSIGGQIVTVTQASFSSAPPFGTIDTPADNTTGLSGTMSVTGWALDDVGVARVRIYRDPVVGEAAGQPVFIGNATFVDGARPDVQAVYSAFPNASRAGWGLQVLTNMLPNRGNGPFRFYAYADDVDGHTTLLGFKTVMVDNANSVLPFGTIDTPGQGDTVSGVMVSFGWALSSALIPVDGSTIDVLIDGAPVGHPVYNNFRSDIASLFPNFPNSNGAIGYVVLDTTRLSNGLHSIAWIVRDSSGGAQGIGSRFFTVAN